MRSSSRRPCPSNRHSSTLVALAENRAKLTPEPSHRAPSGNGEPCEMREALAMGPQRQGFKTACQRHRGQGETASKHELHCAGIVPATADLVLLEDLSTKRQPSP